MMENVKKKIKEIKDYATNSMKGLKKTVSKEDVDPLIKLKEVIKDVETRKPHIDLDLDTTRNTLLYFKQKGGQMDKIMEQLDNSSSLWADVSKQTPLTANSIVPFTKIWSANIETQIEQYNVEMAEKLKKFKTMGFWEDEIGLEGARKSLSEANRILNKESELLAQKTGLCRTFDFPHLVKKAQEIMSEMQLNVEEMKKLWDVIEELQEFI